ncbi:hypothetical protein FAUST_9885 [Fusarium austroamericanum]|uniref:NACHT domain-containing protein n=1 Tax=Fusarium austroamericanum TaxID=282268 RepID=A0AAN5Z2A4_FUSAU|nr:hypothetical protein FAUST_9885 [Fusarium austroamericanum]
MVTHNTVSFPGNGNQGFQLGVNEGTIGDIIFNLKETKDRCLNDLLLTDPFGDKERIKYTKGGLLEGSYKWILDHSEYRRWRDHDHNQLLWIKGDPGKGKTMLLIGIVDEIERHLTQRKQADESTSHATVLSYFFCQATDSNLNNATAVLRGLIFLLAAQRPSLASNLRKKYEHLGTKLFEGDNAFFALSDILSGMLQDPSLNGAVLIIDALDECKTNRHQLLDFITKPSRAKWIVSSRNWPDIEEKLDNAKRKVRLHLELNKDSISKAVRIYIRHKVNRLAEQKKYDRQTRDTVEQHLASSANDTFLWVALVCQELEKTEAWEVLDTLKTIPAGLNDLYDRMIQHIQNPGRQNPEMCRNILTTVAVAYRPLRLEELGLLSGLPSSIQRSTDHISKITSMCGSFLTIRDNIVYTIHQSAKDFLVLSSFLFPSGTGHQHHALFSRSLEALSETLRRDIYGLSTPGFSIDQVLRPSPDPLASTRYSCIYWADHLDDSYPAERVRDLQDGNVVYIFLKKHFLHWLEALSLSGSMSEGVRAVHKLEALVKTTGSQQLAELLQDARRFILSHKRSIEISPLQAYASALVFSPENSLIRQLFKKEEPDWIISKPRMEADWNVCLQTLEGHSSSVTSVVFSADGQRLASGSYDKTVKIWDAATGACKQTLEGHGD